MTTNSVMNESNVPSCMILIACVQILKRAATTHSLFLELQQHWQLKTQQNSFIRERGSRVASLSVRMLRATHLAFRRVKGTAILRGPVGGFSTATDSQRLAGKVAVITGAASGIGKATAAEFVRNGAKVILADVQDDAGRAVAAELGAAASYTRCDVTDEAQIAAAVDLAVARHGHLDVLYSNAGVAGASAPAPLASLDLADFDRVMAANARSAVAALKHAARVMVPRGAGCVLCTGSTTGMLGGLAALPYSLSKATVIAVVRAAADELARSGVRVNAISPHAIATPLLVRSLARLHPGVSDEQLRRMVETGMSELRGAVLQVEDVARAAVYLASDEAKFVTGHNLVVDGGFTASKRIGAPAAS